MLKYTPFFFIIRKEMGLKLARCLIEPSTFPSNTFAQAGFVNLNLRTLCLTVKTYWFLLYLFLVSLSK